MQIKSYWVNICLEYPYGITEFQTHHLLSLLLKSVVILRLFLFTLQLDFRTPPGFDRTRNAEIGNKNIKLHYLEEAYTTEHWLVRIYRVKRPGNRFAEIDHAAKRAKRRTSSRKVFALKALYLKGKDGDQSVWSAGTGVSKAKFKVKPFQNLGWMEDSLQQT